MNEADLFLNLQLFFGAGLFATSMAKLAQWSSKHEESLDEQVYQEVSKNSVSALNNDVSIQAIPTYTNPISGNFAASYPSAEAEHGKFVVANIDDPVYSGYPVDGRGKFVMLTYDVNELEAVDFSQAYPSAEAERGKFVKLDLDTETGYPSGGRGKYAVLTYNCNNYDSRYLRLSGGTMLGDIDMGGHDIYNVNRMDVTTLNMVYETSGFDVTGDVAVNGAVSIGNSGEDAYIYYDDIGPNSPGMRFDSSRAAWQISNNGVLYSDIDIKGGAGALEIATITDNGDATIDVSSINVILYSASSWSESIAEYNVPAITNLAVSLNFGVNYLTVTYNSGNPVYYITSIETEITDSDVVLIATIFRHDNDLHYVVNNWGLSTASRANRRLVDAQRFVRTSGLSLTESAGRIINISAGVLWWGITEFEEVDVSSDTGGNNAEFWHHVAGTWDYTAVSTYNNTQYDDGTNLVAVGNNEYVVNWVYRFINTDSLERIGYVVSDQRYNTLAQAQASLTPEDLPDVFTTQAILVGRIIAKEGTATATQIDSAFTQLIAGSTVTSHNNLGGIQGGSSDQYYHLTAEEYTYSQSVSGLIDTNITNITSLSANVDVLNSKYVSISADISAPYYIAQDSAGYLFINPQGANYDVFLPTTGDYTIKNTDTLGGILTVSNALSSAVSNVSSNQAASFVSVADNIWELFGPDEAIDLTTDTTLSVITSGGTVTRGVSSLAVPEIFLKDTNDVVWQLTVNTSGNLVTTMLSA